MLFTSSVLQTAMKRLETNCGLLSGIGLDGIPKFITSRSNKMNVTVLQFVFAVFTSERRVLEKLAETHFEIWSRRRVQEEKKEKEGS